MYIRAYRVYKNTGKVTYSSLIFQKSRSQTQIQTSWSIPPLWCSFFRDSADEKRISTRGPGCDNGYRYSTNSRVFSLYSSNDVKRCTTYTFSISYPTLNPPDTPYPSPR